MDKNNLEVTCYSGHTYAQEPRTFRWQGVDYDVAKIEKIWREPGKTCFLARTGGNKSFQLCYNEIPKEWSIVELVNQG